MPVDLRRVRRLVTAQAAARERITARFAAALRRRWAPQSRDLFYRREWIDETAAWSADLSRTTATTWAEQAARHIEMQLAEIDIRFEPTARQRRQQLNLPERFRNVDPLEMWQRPAQEYRWLVSRGVPQDDALDRAVARAVLLGEMEVQLADRAGSELRLQNPTGTASAPTITGYRRIIHPERSQGGTCGLCIAAADRLYSVEDLRAVHNRCYCTVLAVIENEDPGAQLNAADLKALYKAAGDSTDRQDLAKTRWKVEQHSELGPVLVQQGQHFKTSDEVEADESATVPAVLPYRQAT